MYRQRGADNAQTTQLKGKPAARIHVPGPVPYYLNHKILNIEEAYHGESAVEQRNWKLFPKVLEESAQIVQDDVQVDAEESLLNQGEAQCEEAHEAIVLQEEDELTKNEQYQQTGHEKVLHADRDGDLCHDVAGFLDDGAEL